MNATANYTASLIDAITPELMRRLEIVAERRHLSLGEVIVDFLTRGANTPRFLGVGVNTTTRRRAGIATREKRAGWHQSRPTASFHSLRHTFVTRCVEAGVPVAVVRELVGHTRETMTLHYTHISAEAMEAALSALAK